jgi:hypothetical protein
MTLSSVNANLPLLIGSSLVAGNVSVLSDSNLFYNPTSNTLVCQQITGNASNATNAINTQNVSIAPTTSSTNFYLTFATSNSGNNALLGATVLRFQPSTGILLSPNLNATTSITTPLLYTSNGGTVRIIGTTSQYSEFQQSSVGFGYDLNLLLPLQGGFNVSSGGVVIGIIPTTQPATTDNSQNLATTAWVKSLTNSSKFTITNTSPITSTPFTTLLNSITLTGLTNNGIFFLSGGTPNLQNYLTIKLTYTINDNLNTSIVNFTSTLMLFPQRISGNISTSQNFGLGAVPQTVYNLNNNLNNNTTFGYTNITYCPNGRQYYSTSPNGGVISGVSAGLDTLYLNGEYATGIAKFGFNLKPWSQTTIPYGASTTAFLTMSLEVLYNPDPNVIISFSNS